ncbi:SSS sodium solute transporter [Umezakia ovalisporum]|jgi:sodium/proline symporter|uniref:sodium/proline symporter n=1 Tax=Umezakia ovalisporum TaxID=75695 RepID=UPI0006F1C1CC|nr:sodium/proline symporter [Umezakia ovalisporum]MBI1240220.1 sodium/solute symporter [Nostoc sp. RI_552]MDH6086579.1 sodium/proline symporter [Umezakia ovalisporum TAC611]CEJ42204.1 SSS sodium solute transporter [Umezakia ovalisporum]
MSNQLLIAAAFIGFLCFIIFVGIYSVTYKQNTTADYILASRGVNPWLTALSAMSTGQSGLLFLGQVGFAYKIGISSIWLVIGWAIGDYLAWLFFFKRLRQVSEETSSDTVSAFLSQNVSGARWISIISSVIIITFLTSYAASQLVAGSKALSVVFGWDYYLGIILGAIIVIIYCFSGGVRAEIWTDAAQGIVMIASLLLLLTIAIANCGGIGEFYTKLALIDPQLVNLSPKNLPLGFFPFLIGWIVAGFGVVGQPHILVRAMAIDSPKNVNRALNIKTACGLINSFSAIGIGLTARILLPDLISAGDPELALPYLAQELLPDVFVGIMLSGVFAATMSSADSQILCCSAALTQDIFPQFAKSYKIVKLGTITITIIVLSIALVGDKNVFLLVTFSWSALASALGPLLILRVFRLPVNTLTAILMMAVGIATAMTWNLGLNLSAIIYEVLPGMASGILIYLITRFFIWKQTAS